MRLVKCKKCGTPIMLDTNIVENMYAAMLECNANARKAANANARNSYIQEAAQIKKMITQIQHRTTQIEERKTTVLSELSEIIHYLRSNKIISDEVLDELRSKSREKAKIKNKEDEKYINKIYGDFENAFINRTKRDTTASQALKKLK